MSIELFNQNFGTIHSTEQSPDTDQDYKSEQYFKNDVTPTMFFVLFKPKNLICTYFKTSTQVTEVIQESLYFGNYAMSTESIKAKVFYVQL